ncbi:MAG: cadherin repeat domain-containing protein, partial [Campylobacterales bacterium]|nr:cadherin repeat domain-containing protein [Campylobacterales bacterium]
AAGELTQEVTAVGTTHTAQTTLDDALAAEELSDAEIADMLFNVNELSTVAQDAADAANAAVQNANTVTATADANPTVTNLEEAQVAQDLAVTLGSIASTAAQNLSDAIDDLETAANLAGETFDMTSAQESVIAATNAANSATEAGNINDKISNLSDTDVGNNTLNENVADGTYTGVTLSATDVDGDAITYSLPEDVPFRVEADGRVVVNGDNAIDFETTPSYTFDVTATSSDGTSSTQSITIDVADVVENAAPVAVDDSATNTGEVLVSENFENGASGWSNNTVTQTDGELGDFLGRFGGTNGEEGVFKTFDFGVEHAGETVTIDFDMYRIDSWDRKGYKGEGEERFQVFINSELVSNELNGDTNDYTMTSNNEFTGWGSERVNHYTFEATVDENGQVRLGFGSTLHQSIRDESWGIDNVVITSGNDWSTAIETKTQA